MMEIVQTWIAVRASERTAAGSELVAEYLQRSKRYCPCSTQSFSEESLFWNWVTGGSKGAPSFVVVLDANGRQMASKEFADRIGRLRDDGMRRMVLAVGPADGWSEASRGRADLVLSLGLMTLPHQLARVVLAEQVYRALTILAGHPYHCGH